MIGDGDERALAVAIHSFDGHTFTGTLVFEHGDRFDGTCPPIVNVTTHEVQICGHAPR